MIPGTKVFYGEPLMKELPSKIVATAKTVEGEISGCDDLMAFNKFS